MLAYLADFDLTAESAEYQVPVYYLLGGRDWQAPFVIAENYFADISATDATGARSGARFGVKHPPRYGDADRNEAG
ncbi:hypothetical protein [Paenibacillus dendritiformis]|uniref:hypothetical protein n=1 Tax=Paenibacillus dendritiformis TaxID=130049 RepID=UPI0020C2D71F|nr:hypothetical protein [Paenibacillus dendritiformis]CAH8769544.1 hypothetical protein H7S4_002275 [Paenibacillus dendritiformis]